MASFSNLLLFSKHFKVATDELAKAGLIDPFLTVDPWKQRGGTQVGQKVGNGEGIDEIKRVVNDTMNMFKHHVEKG